METLRNKQKLEAINRLKMLKVINQVIKDFKAHDVVYYSEYQNKIFNAVLYTANDFIKKEIKKFEEKHNALVYHCMLARYEFGTCLSMLYVSANEEERGLDRIDINRACAYAYVDNLSDPFCSEIGLIGLKPSMGGVRRVY